MSGDWKKQVKADDVDIVSEAGDVYTEEEYGSNMLDFVTHGMVTEEMTSYDSYVGKSILGSLGSSKPYHIGG